MQEEFKSRLEIVITKKSSMKVTVDEEWLSEKEMRDDYHWSACHGSIESSGAYSRVSTKSETHAHSWVGVLNLATTTGLR